MNDLVTSANYHYKGSAHVSHDMEVYNILGFVKLKEPVTGEWVEAVSYVKYYDPHVIFVRELDDFKNKFTISHELVPSREGVEL